MASDYTPHYLLDKYVASDKPNLRDQYNAAMDKIDLALLSANTNATEAKAKVDNFDAEISGKADSADLTALEEQVTSSLNSMGAQVSAVSAAVSSKANQSDVTALADSFSSYKSAKTFMLAIGNSWLVHNAYGAYLSSWMSTMYGETIHCYGRSGAGWMVPYNGQLVQDAVTDAINAHQSNGAMCTDIFLLEMQNDHSLFQSTDDPTGYADKIKEQVGRLRNAFPKAKFHYIIDNAKSTTTAEYRNFCKCMERNFAFDFIYTLFFFGQTSTLDTAHLANNQEGYGRLAQIIHRAATGGEQTYPLLQFDLVSDTNGLIVSTNPNKYVQFRGNPLKNGMKIRVQVTVDPDVASTAFTHKLRCANTYNINTTLLHYLLGNGFGFAYVHGKSLDFAPAYISIVAGGDLQLNLSPELKSWLSTTSDTTVLFVADINAVGLFPL